MTTRYHNGRIFTRRAISKRWGALISICLGAGFAGIISSVSPLAFAAAAGVASLLLLMTLQAAAMPLLFIASASDRFTFLVAGTQIRVDIVATMLVAALVATRLAVRTLRLDLMRSGVTLGLVGYLLCNVGSTVLFATERARGLRLDAEIASALLTFVVLLALLATRGALESAIRALWMVTVLEAVIGLVSLALYLGHLSGYGVQQGDFGLPMVYGVQFEANIFGSFLLGNFFILLGDYVRSGHSRLAVGGLLITLAGIASSMTRTVWLALLVGCLLFVILLLRRRGTNPALVPILATLPVLAIGGLLVGAATPFAGRILDVFNLHSSSASGRAAIFSAAVADWRQHPVFGLGTGSFNFGAAPGQPHPWLPNLTLLTLHDTGAVGLCVLVLLVVAFFRVTAPALRRNGDLAPIVAGSVAGFTSLLIAFQTTTGFWFAYPWIVAALGVVAARLEAAPV